MLYSIVPFETTRKNGTWCSVLLEPHFSPNSHFGLVSPAYHPDILLWPPGRFVLVPYLACETPCPPSSERNPRSVVFSLFLRETGQYVTEAGVSPRFFNDGQGGLQRFFSPFLRDHVRIVLLYFISPRV